MLQTAIERLALTLAAVFALSLSAIATDTTGFRVESYLPEKLTDYEWRVEGDLDFSGQSHKESGYERDPLAYDFFDGEQDVDQQNASLLSHWKYHHYSVDRDFDVSLLVTTRIDNQESDRHEAAQDTLGRITEDSISVERFQYIVRFSPAIGVKEYVAGDVFGAIHFNYSYYYSQSPGEDRFRKRYSSENRFDGSVRERSQALYEDTDGDQKGHNLKVECTAGWGRKYEGRFAAMAMNMIGELRDAGLLLREPDRNEMMQLTDLVYRYRLTHAVDSRLHRMEALESIVGFLREEGVMAESEAVAQYLIQDVWDYFPGNDSRQFGLTVSGGVGVTIVHTSSQRSVTQRSIGSDILRHMDGTGNVDTVVYVDTFLSAQYTKRVYREPYATCAVSYAKPVNLRWQLEAGARLDWYVGAQNLREMNHEVTTEVDYQDLWRGWLSASAEYFHDERTSVRFYGNYYRQDGDREEPEPAPDEGAAPDLHYWTLSFGAEVEYRLSVPTTLVVDLDWWKTDREVLAERMFEENSDGYGLSLSFTHHIF